MTVQIIKGETFILTFSNGKRIELSHQEWMELRKMQNSLIYTEPV